MRRDEVGVPQATVHKGGSRFSLEDTPVEWTAPPSNLVASPLAVDVWRFSLRGTGPTTAAYAGLLSDDERERAARFRAQQHHDRFVIGRGVLRTVLGAYAGIEPASVRFRYDPAGKPHLDPARLGMSFNLSHSDDLALLAVSCERQLGIDVERVRSDFGADRIAARVLPAHDVAAIRALTGPQRDEMFFALWTRLEALVKGSGEGLGRATVRLHAPHEDTGSMGEWVVRQLIPEPGYVAALAVESRAYEGFSLRFWQFTETGDLSAGV